MSNSQYTLFYNSPIGALTIAAKGESITGIWMENQKYFGAGLEKDIGPGELPVHKKAVQWLDLYFAGKKPDFDLPLAPKGSAFRHEVWNILCAIPYGQVITYGDIAREIAEKMGKETMSAQAVGGAVGHNPISIVIPCHRVVGRGGSLTGYAGGMDKKLKLLQLEGVDTSMFTIPAKGTAL